MAKRAQLGRKKASKKTQYRQSKSLQEMAMEPESIVNKERGITIPIAPVMSDENKNQRLELRLTKLQKDFISKASSVSGFKNVSDYILYIAINDSKNVIRDQQIFELSERDRVSFMETLENPPKAGENLQKAMTSYLSFKKSGK